MSKIIFALPDQHHPWSCWDRLAVVAEEVKIATRKKSNTVKVINLGDIIDSMAWSRYPKGPDAPNAQAEWDATEVAMHRLAKMFPEMTILSGNHCVRPMKKALEAQLPRQLIKGLDQVFDIPGWEWHMGNRLYEHDNVVFCHGDEFPISVANIGLAASRLGKSLVFGHTHQAALVYVNIFDKSYYAMNCGAIVDDKAVCFQYAAKNPRRTWQGYGMIVDGQPHLVAL